jgi:hypothetical protein
MNRIQSATNFVDLTTGDVQAISMCLFNFFLFFLFYGFIFGCGMSQFGNHPDTLFQFALLIFAMQPIGYSKVIA